MQIAILLVLGLCIAVQLPHTFWVFRYTSGIYDDKDYIYRKEETTYWNTGKFQAFCFCGIFTFAGIVCVLLRLHIPALAFVTLEMAFNIFYVYCHYTEKYVTQGDNMSDHAKARKARKMYGAYAIGVIMPLLIAGLSYLYIEFDSIQPHLEISIPNSSTGNI